MNTFWFYAWSLSFVCVAFVLLPLIRTTKENREINRTDVNTKLYLERLHELDSLYMSGLLNPEQLEIGEAELARELLEEAHLTQPSSNDSIGRTIPILLTLSIPLLAIFLYTHWGAHDQLSKAQELNTQLRPAIDETIIHLETLLKNNPDSAEGWTLLGRAYMQAKRMNDASRAFESAISIEGTTPDLLGRYAQSIYLGGGQNWTPQLQSMIEEALASNPREPISLKLAGSAAFHDGRFEDAEMYWRRLLAVIPEMDPARISVEADIEKAHQLAKK